MIEHDTSFGQTNGCELKVGGYMSVGYVHFAIWQGDLSVFASVSMLPCIAYGNGSPCTR